MSLPGQRLQSDRYTLVPRTLVFLFHDESLLLMRIPPDRGEWAGQYNGLGGHIEMGEDPRSAARREVHEESGLDAVELQLCGVITIDTHTTPGIGLYVFFGQVEPAELQPCSEGSLEWIPIESLQEIPLVEDLPAVLPKVLACKNGAVPFSAQYTYSDQGQLHITFADP